jgi:hypothetical protein
MKKKKIGRNDPCPCGSGVKYKKCCIDKPRTTHRPHNFNSKGNPLQELVNHQAAEAHLRKLLSNIPKSKPKRRKHHYVPIWYQKRFIPEGQKILHYLNLNPFIELPDKSRVKGREVYKQGPGSCFCEKDLYTTRFFGIRDESIEEFLFGKIDNTGPEAILGLVLNDPHLLHKYFQEIFLYIDAQKLRTPKGLQWIRSNYFQLTHSELLLEMQFLRTMHCTMWVEGVMEIVSAEDSDIKFIISDHPVTIYNPACSPEVEICQYPNDPPTAWKGSQTIFPLDLNHCFIMTNLEYARDPDGVDPIVSRTNPRFFAQTITRWDAVIRERKLKPEEVCAINYIIKRRACNNIAAANQDWLYPETTYSQNDWQSLSKILLPPENKIHMYGGEIYVGGKDGGLAWYQDAFGRRHSSEYQEDPIRSYSIKRRNEILFNAIYKIFGFNKGKSWDDFRKELADEKIKELYGVIGSLWNPDTEITKLLPKPEDEVRAFYHGSLDPRITPYTVEGYSLYVDKIIMYSPFLNPRAMNKEYSPYEHPAQYRNDTIKNVLLMLELEPLIAAGIIEMIPDPCDFDTDFRMRIYKMAEARMKYRGINKKDMDFAQELMREDTKKSILDLPPESLAYQFKKASPDTSEEEIKKAVEYAQKIKLADPLACLQPMTPGKDGGQMHVFRMSGNHEMALYLAQITGSFLFTDIKHCWKEYQSATLKRPGENNIDPWAPLTKVLNGFNLTMYHDPDLRFWYQIKEKEYLKEFINFYKSIILSLRTIDNPEAAAAKAEDYVEHIKDINLEKAFKKIEEGYKKWSKGSSEKLMQYRVKIPASYLIPTNGISSNTITQILLTHGMSTSYWNAVPLGLYLDLKKMKND